MTDLTLDFDRMEKDYKMKCRGPSSTNFDINRDELEEKLKKTLEERVEIYKLCCFMVLVVSLGLITFRAFGLLSGQFFTTAIVTGMTVFAIFYLSNPLLQETMDWWFIIDAIIEN